MGRNKKQGFEYFSVDIDLFGDIKVRRLIRRHGAKGVATYIALLCMIYKEGYFLRWNEDIPFIISEQTMCDEAEVREVIKSCTDIGLFDAEAFERDGVLTSVGIQVRYDMMVKLCGRKKNDVGYRLFSVENEEKEGENSDILERNSDFSGEKGHFLERNGYLLERNANNDKNEAKIGAKRGDLSGKTVKNAQGAEKISSGEMGISSKEIGISSEEKGISSKETAISFNIYNKRKEKENNKEKIDKKESSEFEFTGSDHDNSKNDLAKKSDGSTGEKEKVAPKEKEAGRSIFRPPEVEDVKAYCREQGYGVDAEAFCDFYQSKGWMVGSNRMKDWRAAVRTWERGNKNRHKNQSDDTDWRNNGDRCGWAHITAHTAEDYETHF